MLFSIVWYVERPAQQQRNRINQWKSKAAVPLAALCCCYCCCYFSFTAVVSVCLRDTWWRRPWWPSWWSTARGIGHLTWTILLAILMKRRPFDCDGRWQHWRCRPHPRCSNPNRSTIRTPIFTTFFTLEILKIWPKNRKFWDICIFLKIICGPFGQNRRLQNNSNQNLT